MMKINNFRGDVTDISAKKEALTYMASVLCDPMLRDQTDLHR